MSSIKSYIVVCTSKFPAYNETPGTYHIFARTSADAIKEARKMMARTGHDSRRDGPVFYRASLATRA